MFLRALRPGCLQRFRATTALRQQRPYATAHNDIQASIRDAFVDIQNSISLVDQGDRIRDAEKQAKELEKDLEVSGIFVDALSGWFWDVLTVRW